MSCSGDHMGRGPGGPPRAPATAATASQSARDLPPRLDLQPGEELLMYFNNAVGAQFHCTTGHTRPLFPNQERYVQVQP